MKGIALSLLYNHPMKNNSEIFGCEGDIGRYEMAMDGNHSLCSETQSSSQTKPNTISSVQ